MYVDETYKDNPHLSPKRLFSFICSWRPRRCWLAGRFYCGSTRFYLIHCSQPRCNLDGGGARKIRDPHWRHCIFFYLDVFTQIKQKRPKYDVWHAIFCLFHFEMKQEIACLFEYSHSSLPSNPFSNFCSDPYLLCSYFDIYVVLLILEHYLLSGNFSFRYLSN